MSFQFKIILTLLLVPASIRGFTQSRSEKELVISEYRPIFISLPPAENKCTPSMRVSSIEVVDVRFDTLSAGLIHNSIVGKEKLIHFKKGTANEIKDYYRSGVVLTPRDSNDNTVTIFCFIKKLFISDHIYIDGDRKVSSKEPAFEIKSGAMAIFEFYAKPGESFIPLYRFDSTVTGGKSIIHNGRTYIKEMLEASVRKLGLLNWEKIQSNSKPKSRSEVDDFNHARFNVPILKENPRKGIYPSFESFKKNTPLDSSFYVEKTKKGDYLYFKNKKGEDFLHTELWGYSDGKDSYIYSAENYFKLYRYGNTFLINGAKDFTSVRKLRLNFGLLDMAMPNSNYAKTKTANSYKLEFDLFQLDMETGELY